MKEKMPVLPQVDSKQASRRSEVRRQITEDRGQRTEFRIADFEILVDFYDFYDLNGLNDLTS